MVHLSYFVNEIILCIFTAAKKIQLRVSNYERQNIKFNPIFSYALIAWLSWRRHHIQHNDIQHNDIQHNDIQYNDIQHNDIQHNNIQHNDIQHKDIQHIIAPKMLLILTSGTNVIKHLQP